MNDFFSFFLDLFTFPMPDFCIGALVFLGVFVLVYNLLFRRKAFRVRK